MPLCIIVRGVKTGGVRYLPNPEPVDLPQEIIDSLPAGTVREMAPPPPPLRYDGPTLEAFVEAGYKPEHYPPEGFAERDSPGLRDYRATVKKDRLAEAQARVAAVVGTAGAAAAAGDREKAAAGKQ